MIELERVRGPLDDGRLADISRLYGPVDAKYRSLGYLRHQFAENPFGWAAHVFATADGRAVGHCGVVPFRARRDGEVVAVGKLEGLAVEQEFRGRRDDGGSVATDVLRALYAFAHDQELPVLFGLAPPAVARIHLRAGCKTVPSNAPAYVQVTSPRTFAQGTSRRRRAAAGALAAGQRAVQTPFATEASLADVAVDDAGLVATAADEGWTVSGADAWDWYRGAGVLRALEVPGPAGGRAIIRLDDSQAATVQIVAWRPRRPGLRAGARLLAAAARVAREHGAPTLRFQPWASPGSDESLATACRLLGFVTRPEADLLLHVDGDTTAWDGVRLTPFFYVTF